MDLSSPTLEATRGRLLARFGQDVEAWWSSLPTTLADLAARWHLVVGDAIGRGNTSLVVRCRRSDGGAAVLKLTPDTAIAAAEISALRMWAPTRRVPAVWHSDASLGAVLLEAVRNETPLSELGTPVALDDVAALIRALHRTGTATVRGGMPTLADRIEFIFAHWIERHSARGTSVTRTVPVERLHRGHELARELAADAVPAVLLHGDLHAGNVLDGGPRRGLVAIDPRPCVGDAAVDAVDWVFWGVDRRAAWERRSHELALALGVDGRRLWAWCAAFAAMVAAGRAAAGAADDEIDALLALAP